LEDSWKILGRFLERFWKDSGKIVRFVEISVEIPVEIPPSSGPTLLFF
jgi:hypothetical protein